MLNKGSDKLIPSISVCCACIRQLFIEDVQNIQNSSTEMVMLLRNAAGTSPALPQYL
ncbi:MAG TPA: hypothetical protein VE619_11270 [Nitrososphaeraceae archaeon]|nr:hypothetical protein [Nitrososphaeraceae archaeon]